MKILRILTKSGHTLDLSLDGNGEVCYLKVSDTNELTPFSTIVELDLDEVHELLDSLEVKADEMELDDFLSPKSSDLSESEYMRLLNRDMPMSHGYIVTMPFNQEPLPPDLEFPTGDDVEQWLNDESDKD